MPGQNMVLYDNVVEVVGRGITLYSEGKYDAAFDVLVELRRDPVAALFLGTMLHDCDDFIKEDKNSLDKLMRLSFDNVAAIRQRGKGDPRILTMLGVAYYIGISCFPQNNNIVFELFSHASAANDARGIYWLAVCVRYGYGVYENETRATNLFRNATELEDGYALSDMALLYHSVNEQISYMYHCYSSMVGFEKKSYCAGMCLEFGVGCDVDVGKAISYYKRGARAADSDCCRQLSKLIVPGEEAAFYSVLASRKDSKFQHPSNLLPYIAAAELRAAIEFPERVIPDD